MTLTIEEFEEMIADIRVWSKEMANLSIDYIELGNERAKLNRYVIEAANVLWVFNTWEQGKFTFEEFTNYTNEYYIRKAYSRIKEIYRDSI